jgi:hypothetical protein
LYKDANIGASYNSALGNSPRTIILDDVFSKEQVKAMIPENVFFFPHKMHSILLGRNSYHCNLKK